MSILTNIGQKRLTAEVDLIKTCSSAGTSNSHIYSGVSFDPIQICCCDVEVCGISLNQTGCLEDPAICDGTCSFPRTLQCPEQGACIAYGNMAVRSTNSNLSRQLQLVKTHKYRILLNFVPELTSFLDDMNLNSAVINGTLMVSQNSTLSVSSVLTITSNMTIQSGSTLTLQPLGVSIIGGS